MPLPPPWDPRCPPHALVRPVRVDPAGVRGPTPNQARGPRWRRTSRGWYVPAAVDAGVPEQRVLEASLLLGPGGAVTGWAALRLAGAAYYDGRAGDDDRRVPLVAGPGQARRPRPGVRWAEDRVEVKETWLRHGVRATRPLRALFDDMRSAHDVRLAAVSMDMAAAAELVSVRRMRDHVRLRAGWNGVGLVRRALDLSDDDSRSPGESRLRLTWTLDTEHPRPLANREVFDERGRLLCVADLLDPVAGVVGEYDGAEHARPGRRSRDAARDSAFRDHGLEVFRVTGYDEHRSDVVRDRTASAYDRARHGRLPRRWTLDPPPGRPRTPTLDEELDLRDVLRELHAG